MDVPQLLVYHPPPFFTFYEQEYTKKFNILKINESHSLFHAQYSSKALMCFGKSPITANVLRCFPLLRLVVTASTGFNHIDIPECRLRGIAVANTADVFSDDTADMAVGLLIDVLRDISAGDRFVRAGVWPTNLHHALGSQLGGRHVGIVGLGTIGSKVATRLQAFGCKISYNSREKKPVPYNLYPEVCELASHCNILVICCALTIKTRHMIDKDVLIALGKDGFLVNIARGPIIDEKEMVKFLVEGEIAGAGMNVFENEPNVPQELFSMDNVVLTPHNAGYTKEAYGNAFRITLANLEAFFANKPLISPVIDE